MAGQMLGSAPGEVGGSFLRPDKWGNLSGMRICFKPEGGQLRFVQVDVEFDVSVCLAADQGRKARMSPVWLTGSPQRLLGTPRSCLVLVLGLVRSCRERTPNTGKNLP